MDVEQLIAAVFKRPLIWDKRMKEYANRNLVDKAWKEISKEMNSEGKFHFLMLYSVCLSIYLFV